MNLSWIKKMAKYFKDENVHEEAPEQPGLYQARPDKIDTRVAYHYPKKQFRFPVIPDQEGARRKTAEKPEKQRPRAKKHRPEPQSERSEKVQKGHPFRPTDIPSPVFGFKRPTNDSAQEETTVLEYELEDHYKKDIRLLDMAKLQQLLDFAENPGTDGERNLTTPEHGMADQLFEEKKWIYRQIKPGAQQRIRRKRANLSKRKQGAAKIHQVRQMKPQERRNPKQHTGWGEPAQFRLMNRNS